MLRIDRLIVLVADDDEVVRKVIMEHLEIFGFKNTLEARDGSEAYRFSQERMKISKAKQHHVDSYIVKPFKGDVLSTKIMHVLFEAEKKKNESGVA